MVQQNTQEWLELRKKYIGSSDASVIMGTNIFKMPDGRIKTPYILWMEKLGLMDCSYENPAMKYGKQMEETARWVYMSKTDIIVQPAVVIHKNIPYMMSSLDGLSVDGKRAVEIKCCNAEDHATAKSGKVPDKYYAQVQHQIECLQCDGMDYFSYHKDEGIIVRVNRDDDYIKEMLKRYEKFWNSVVNLEQPEMTDKDFIEMNDEWGDKAKMLWEIQETIRINEKLADEIKEELKTLSEGRNSTYGPYRLVVSARKGQIDYKAIPELNNVDIEKYRKSASCVYTLKKFS